MFQQTTNIPQTTVERTTKMRSLQENTKKLTTESISEVENSTILVTKISDHLSNVSIFLITNEIVSNRTDNLLNTTEPGF